MDVVCGDNWVMNWPCHLWLQGINFLPLSSASLADSDLDFVGRSGRLSMDMSVSCSRRHMEESLLTA